MPLVVLALVLGGRAREVELPPVRQAADDALRAQHGAAAIERDSVVGKGC